MRMNQCVCVCARATRARACEDLLRCTSRFLFEFRFFFLFNFQNKNESTSSPITCQTFISLYQVTWTVLCAFTNTLLLKWTPHKDLISHKVALNQINKMQL